MIKQKTTPKTVKVATNTPEALDNLYKELLEQDIMKQINTNPYSHPNVNYNTLLSVLEESKQKHIPAKSVKFHKHKHKKTEWITKGILKSIKYRDSLYKKIKLTQIGSVEYNTNRINLRTYNKILKRSIRIAKINYYSSCFNKYKNDIKKTWQTISEIMNKKHTDTTHQEFFEMNGIKIVDKIDIANKFNQYFTNIGPDLATNISRSSEKVIYDQTYSYFQNNVIFYSSQYGFRQGHSSEYAALELIDKITQHLDRNKTPINFYLDLSKAFDTLDHSILIHKLKFYGIKGTALQLFQSYLSNRLQCVEYDIMSDTLEISTGVPQGSVLGPLLFLIYINDIAKSSDSFDFICYADDTTLSSIMNYFISTEKSIENSINEELAKVNDWLKINKLSLNINKTKFMIFHNYQQQITMPNIFIDNVAIECVPN